MRKETRSSADAPSACDAVDGEPRETDWYLLQLLTCPPITLRQERELIQRLEDQASDRPAILRRLVEGNLSVAVRLSRRCLQRYEPPDLTLQDLIALANLGLVEAARTFDPTRGRTFREYAGHEVRRALYRSVVERQGMITLPAWAKEAFGRFNHLTFQRFQAVGPDLLDEHLLQAAGYPATCLETLTLLRLPPLSLDSPAAPGGEEQPGLEGEPVCMLDALANCPAFAYEEERLDYDWVSSAQLHQGLALLPPRIRQVLYLRYGFTEPLPGDRIRSYQDVASRLGMSQSRVAQLEERAIKELRRFFLKQAIGAARAASGPSTTGARQNPSAPPASQAGGTGQGAAESGAVLHQQVRGGRETRPGKQPTNKTEAVRPQTPSSASSPAAAPWPIYPHWLPESGPGVGGGWSAATHRWRQEGAAQADRAGETPASFPHAPPSPRARRVPGARSVPLGRHPRPVVALACSPDGEHFALVDEEGWVYVYDRAFRLALHLQQPPALRFVGWSPDATRLVTVTDRVIRAWNAHTGEVEVEYRPHRKAIRATAWSPGGRRIASVDDSSVAIWECDTPRERTALVIPLPRFCRQRHLAWSPDCRRIATVTRGRWWPPFRPRHERIRIWDAFDGRELSTFLCEGAVEDLAWSPDGSRLATIGTQDSTLRLWSAEGVLLAEGETGEQDVGWLRWSQDGGIIYALGRAGTLNILQAVTGTRIAQFRICAGGIAACSWSQAERELLWAPAAGTTVYRWQRT